MPLSYQIITKGSSNETINKFCNTMAGNKDSAMNNEELIKNITMSNMVSCLKELSDLSILSNQIFNRLLNDAININERYKNLSDRTKTLYIDIASVKEIQKNSSSIKSSQLDIDIYNNYRQMLQNPQSQQLIDQKSMPINIQLRYKSDKLNRLIDFSKIDMDKHCFKDGDKIKTIAHKYSNPDFFLHQWVLVQEARMKQLDNERKQNKQDKKLRKEKLAEVTTTEVKEKKRKSSIKWQDRYIVDGKAVHRASTVLDKRKSGWGNINIALKDENKIESSSVANISAESQEDDINNTTEVDEVSTTSLTMKGHVTTLDDKVITIAPPSTPLSVKPFSSSTPPPPPPPPAVAVASKAVTAGGGVVMEDKYMISPTTSPAVVAIPPPPPPPPGRLSIQTTNPSTSSIEERNYSTNDNNNNENENDSNDEGECTDSSRSAIMQKISIMPNPQKKTHYLDSTSSSDDLLSNGGSLIVPVLLSRPPPPPPPTLMKQTSLLLKSSNRSENTTTVALTTTTAVVENGFTATKEPFTMQSSNPARSNLFAAIKGGTDLRKVSSEENTNQGKETIKTITVGRESLFDAIKNRSSVLRKVTNEELQQAEEDKKRRNSTLGGFGSSSVSAILERRKFLEAESSSDDSDNDADAWD